MDLLLAFVSLIPLGFLLALMTIFAIRKIRSYRSRRATPGGGYRGGRGGPAGPRGPRRPLVPVGSASAALPEPREYPPPLDARGKVIRRQPPSAIEADDLTDRVSRSPGAFDSVVETCGAAGDVILAHPLLLHSSSHNRGTRPRVMAQPRTDFIAPKRFEGRDLSPVEIVLARGAGRCS